MKKQTNTNLLIRSSLALALAMASWLPIAATAADEPMKPMKGGEHLMMLTTDLGFLDLYDYIPGFPDTPVADVFSDGIELDNLRFVSLRWLRKLKQAAGRHKDLDDLEHLPSP